MSEGRIKLTDESIMPIGKFKGTKMANVPAWWLYWYHMNAERSRFNADIHDYINENMEAIKMELNEND